MPERKSGQYEIYFLKPVVRRLRVQADAVVVPESRVDLKPTYVFQVEGNPIVFAPARRPASFPNCDFSAEVANDAQNPQRK